MQSFFPAKMNTTRKKGFSSPLNQWLQKGLGYTGKKLMLEGSLCKHGLLDKQYLSKVYESMGAENKLLLISAELWFRHWFENDLSSIDQFSLEASKHIIRLE